MMELVPNFLNPAILLSIFVRGHFLFLGIACNSNITTVSLVDMNKTPNPVAVHILFRGGICPSSA